MFVVTLVCISLLLYDILVIILGIFAFALIGIVSIIGDTVERIFKLDQ